jgi:type IV pilus assembly protein PilW
MKAAGMRSAADRTEGGMSLLELLVAIALTAFLLLGLVHFMSAASATALLQRNQGQIQDRARFAIDRISAAIREAGFQPEPWNETWALEGFTADNLDGVTSSSDRLSVRSWSDRNCFDNRNAAADADGNALFYIRETSFDLNSSKGLTRQCRYGPSLAEMTTQIRRQGLIERVESFQLLFAIDADANGLAEAWVNAGAWDDPGQIRGVKVGLLLVSENTVVIRQPKEFAVLDTRKRVKADGRLRHVFQFAVAVRSAQG